MSNLTIKEWTNKGMEKQLTYIFTVDETLPINEQVLGNAVGDVFALTSDSEIGFRIHKSSETTTVVNCLNSTLEFEDYVGEYNIESYALAMVFCSTVNDVHNYGIDCTYNEIILSQLRQFSDENSLNWVFGESFDNAENSTYWTIMSEEYANKCHINDECTFHYSVESAKQCLEELKELGCNPHSTLEFEEVYQFNGDYYAPQMAIVVYNN